MNASVKYLTSHLVLFSLLVFVACGEQLSPEQQQAMIMDQRWLLDEVDGNRNVDNDTLQPNHLMLPSTMHGTAMAFAGCNQLAAKYEISGTDLSFSNVIASRKMCEEMQLEYALVEALERTDRFRIRENKLELFEGRKKLAVFLRDDGEFSLPQIYDPSSSGN
ncbi:MAG: META domain-containing protein [Saprospirales bacterium]|nr:MAG: META domain-containing protein [Saprospirales bacterium]